MCSLFGSTSGPCFFLFLLCFPCFWMIKRETQLSKICIHLIYRDFLPHATYVSRSFLAASFNFLRCNRKDLYLVGGWYAERVLSGGKAFFYCYEISMIKLRVYWQPNHTLFLLLKSIAFLWRTISFKGILLRLRSTYFPPFTPMILDARIKQSKHGKYKVGIK